MLISEVLKKINQLKLRGRVKTNYYPGAVKNDADVVLEENENAIIFIVEEPFRKRVFFASVENEALELLLNKLPSGSVLEYIYKLENDMAKVFVNGGLYEYTYYIRNTIVWSESPYTVDETGKRRLLQDMYDPNCGEYAKKDDAVELYTLTKEIFDTNCDDVFTLEQWENIIESKKCLIYRENGLIISYYVWKLEGKKFYANISVNRGAANILYNLERRVFEDAWNKGIRTYYAWFNKDNFVALNRGNANAKEFIKHQDIIYNGIYIKK